MIFTSDWFSGNIPNWEKWLGHLKDCPAHALEIGSYEGRSACWLMENILTHPDSTLTCVDTWQGGGDLPSLNDGSVYRRFLGNINPWRNRMGILVRSSKTALPELITQIFRYDFIYVDGSHVAADVLMDGALSWELLKGGGILVFDDYTWCEDPNPLHQPGPAIDAFLKFWEGRYEIIGKGYQVALRKK